MREDRLFEEGTIPEYATAEWYAERESAPHVDQWLHRPRIDLAVHMVKRIALSWGYQTVVDLGAGDGGLLSLLRHEPWTTWGYDLQQSNVDASKARGVDVRYGDVLKDEITWGQIAVTTEMLEHLVDPHGFVREIRQHSQAIVASSPHTETKEDHYGYHLWAWDQEGYEKMLTDAGWHVIDHGTTGMFQVVAAVAEL
jgi:2-polyprenyl-3-methyl-5-hydroxy-6-metoxy-1,4-benzoquinol methylase